MSEPSPSTTKKTSLFNAWGMLILATVFARLLGLVLALYISGGIHGQDTKTSMIAQTLPTLLLWCMFAPSVVRASLARSNATDYLSLLALAFFSVVILYSVVRPLIQSQ